MSINIKYLYILNGILPWSFFIVSWVTVSSTCHDTDYSGNGFSINFQYQNAVNNQVKKLTFFTILKLYITSWNVFVTIWCLTAFSLKSSYICEGGGKSGGGLGENSILPKTAQPVRVWKRKRQESEKKKNVKKETANEACFNKGIDGDAGKDVVCIDDKCPRANIGGQVIEGDACVCCGDVVEQWRQRVWPTGGCRDTIGCFFFFY